jgi:hypothetical protein
LIGQPSFIYQGSIVTPAVSKIDISNFFIKKYENLAAHLYFGFIMAKAQEPNENNGL